MSTPRVGIVMGSDSDWPIMEAAAHALAEFGIGYEVKVSSAHRVPHQTIEYGEAAAGRGLQVIIAGAGGAAHLPGVLAAVTPLPVIGVPVPLKQLDGLDFGAVLWDTFNSDIADAWTVTLIRQKLDLKPQDPRISSGERVNFTVALPANVTGNFIYEWSQTSIFATLSAVGVERVAVGRAGLLSHAASRHASKITKPGSFLIIILLYYACLRRLLRWPGG